MLLSIQYRRFSHMRLTAHSLWLIQSRMPMVWRWLEPFLQVARDNLMKCRSRSNPCSIPRSTVLPYQRMFGLSLESCQSLPSVLAYCSLGHRARVLPRSGRSPQGSLMLSRTFAAVQSNLPLLSKALQKYRRKRKFAHSLAPQSLFYRYSLEEGHLCWSNLACSL